MKHWTHATTLSALAVGLIVWVGGCPGTTGTAGDNTPTLTSAEQDAASAAARSAASLGQAVNTAQSPASDDGSSSFDVPLGTNTFEFGLCPHVTMTVSTTGLLVFDMTLEFGEGCQPLGTTSYTCTGNASGSFNQPQQQMSLTFENLSCDGATLTGDVNVTYDQTETEVALDGTWDLTYQDEVGTLQTNGSGTGAYDFNDYVTTVETFTGTLTDEGETYNAVMSNIQMSFPTYERFMPYSGELTLSGSDIRTVIIRFDENSPTTGVVQVSVGGSPFYEMNLYAEEISGGASN